MEDDQKLMLFFECGDKAYAVACSEVVEVIPQVHTKDMIEYHGTRVPVVDFTAMQTGGHSRSVLSTRIILLNTGDASITGLTAEKVLHTEPVSASAFKQANAAQANGCQSLTVGERDISVIDPARFRVALDKESSKAGEH